MLSPSGIAKLEYIEATIGKLQMKDELEPTIDQLKNKPLKELGDNPMRPYLIEFPYQVKLLIAGDGFRTEVLITTSSEEMTFARTKKDALFQKERSDAISKDGYIKHIIEWVADKMYKIDMNDCDLTYTGTADVDEMTDEELGFYQQEVISAAS